MAGAVSGANFRAKRGHCGPKLLEYSGTSMAQELAFKSSCLMNWKLAVLQIPLFLTPLAQRAAVIHKTPVQPQSLYD